MKLVKSVLVAMLLGIMAIQMAWAYVDEYGVDYNLVEAANRGDLKAVKYYIRKGANVNANVSVYGDYGATTPLMEAVRMGHKEVADHLIPKGANIDAHNRRGNTALHLAVEDGDKEMVEYLISKGANVELRYGSDPTGHTALHTALNIYQTTNKKDDIRIKIVKLLIDKGADVNASSFYYGTPLSITIPGMKCNLEIAKYLVENGANVNYRTPLASAIKYCSSKSDLLELVKSLIEKGADVNAEDAYGNTALMYAVSNDSVEIVKYLVSKGADVNAIDNQGKSVFDRADKLNRNDEIFEFLLSSGAKCDDCDE